MEVQRRRSARIAVKNSIVNPFAPLPDELILEICEHISPAPWGGDEPPICRVLVSSTFAALARTCKYLYPFGMRFLCACHRAPRPGTSHGFLRTLHNHPELAPHVREISIGGRDFRNTSRIHDGLSMKEADMIAQIRTLSLPYESALIDVMGCHPEEAELALSIFNARTSIETLRRLQRCPSDDMSHRTVWLTPLLYAAQRYAYAPNDISAGFARLRYLELDMGSIPMANIAPVLRLPSLKTLHLRNVSYGIDHGPWDVLPRSSRVQNIAIVGQSEPPLHHISQLLQSCETITRFRCDRPEKPDDKAVEWHSKLLEAAELHSRSLKKLYLLIGLTGWKTWLDSWPRNNSLSGMGELEELDIHYTAIMGKQQGLHWPHEDLTAPEQPDISQSLGDLLPPNLIMLALQYDRNAMVANIDYTAELRGLLQDKPNRHQKLSRVIIRYIHDPYDAKFPFGSTASNNTSRHVVLNLTTSSSAR